MKKPFFHILSVILLVVGTSLGAGTLGFPVKTGLSATLHSIKQHDYHKYRKISINFRCPNSVHKRVKIREKS